MLKTSCPKTKYEQIVFHIRWSLFHEYETQYFRITKISRILRITSFLMF